MREALEDIRASLRYYGRRLRGALPSEVLTNWQVVLSGDAQSAFDWGSPRLLENPRGRWLADPFVAQDGEHTWVFVEDFNQLTNRAHISVFDAETAFESTNAGSATPCLSEPFHISFPFIFQWQDAWWMAPDTISSGKMRLYRSVSFPEQWRWEWDLAIPSPMVDAVMFEQDGRWWILGTQRSGRSGSYLSQLCAYWAPTPLSPTWTPHPHNPLVSSRAGGRNGGLIRRDHTIFRVAQLNQGDFYGGALSIRHLDGLSTEDFHETNLGTPGWIEQAGVAACHHLSMSDHWLASDARFYQ